MEDFVENVSEVSSSCSLGKVEQEDLYAHGLSKAEAYTGKDEGYSKGSQNHPAPQLIQSPF